jgi:hypothetical protein
MPSDVEYIFRQKNGKVIYRGSDINRLTMGIISRLGFSEEQGVDIGDYVQATWKHHASQIQARTESWRATDYRQDYMDGIQVWRRRGRELVFALHGAQANAVEHGWAPPTTQDWADGIGTYDGEYKDMRPWLLHSGHPQVRHTKREAKKDTDFTVYRFLKFDTPALSEMVETTAQHLAATETAKALADHQTQMNDADRERLLAAARKKIQHTARSSIHRDESGQIMFRPLDMKDVPPAAAYGEHKSWIYHRATIQDDIPFKTMRAAIKFAMHKAQFTVFRTITDSQQQIDRKLFFSKGISPAKLISDQNSPVVEAAKQAIMNVMSGKNPDGSERNGS